MRFRNAVMVAVVLALVSAALWLPTLLQILAESMLVDAVSGVTGGASLNLAVRSIRLDGADLADIAMGEPSSPFVEIGSLRLDYSPGGLMDGQVREIAISGLTLRCRFEDGTLILPGLDWQRLVAEHRSGGASTRQRPFVSPVKKVFCRDSLLLLSRGSEVIRLPFSLELTLEAGERDMAGDLRIWPDGAEIDVRGRFNPATNLLGLTLSADSPNLARLVRLFEPDPPFKLAGGAVFNGSAEMDLQSGKFISGELDGELAHFQMEGAGVRFSGIRPHDAPESEKGLRLHLDGKGDSWNGGLSNLTIRAGGFELGGELSGELRFAADALQYSALLSLHLAADGVGDDNAVASSSLFSIVNPLTTSVQLRGTAEQGGKWQADLTAAVASNDGSEDPIKLRAQEHNLEIDAPMVTASAQGSGFVGKVDWEARLGAARIKGADLNLDLNDIVSTGTGILERDRTGRLRWQTEGTFRAASLSGSAGDMDFNVPVPRLELLAKSDDSGGNASSPFAVTLDFKGGTVTQKRAEIAATGIDVFLPLNWPPESAMTDSDKPGAITVAGLRWQQLDLGPVSITIHQQGSELVVSGRHDSLVLPGVRVLADGKLTLEGAGEPGADLRVRVDQSTFGPIDAGIFDPDMAGMELQGDLALDGALLASRRALSANLEMQYTQGRISYPDKKLVIEGVDFHFILPELPRIRSAPQQLLSFERASIGDLQVTAAQVALQLESPRSLFIERGGADWSQGSISLHGIRINPAKQRYDFTLYCDRLKLASILEQFGIEGVDGDGTVNGLIPVHIDTGRISFDNGFLYSTPGEGGRIRVQGTDILAAGIPEGAPQLSQVDFAGQALKGFVYKWAKISFNTEGDDLVMGLRLDGEPEHVLPFVYRRGKNVFERLGKDESGGIKQPILLDVNFRLPLNQILGYGRGISDLMEKLRQ